MTCEQAHLLCRSGIQLQQDAGAGDSQAEVGGSGDQKLRTGDKGAW